MARMWRPASHHSPALPPRRRALALLAMLCLWGLMGSGCSKSQPAAAPEAKRAPAAAPAAPAAATAQADKQARDHVESAYHLIRCTLVGARLAPEDVYTAQGYADAAAFSQAFQKLAAADPKWAEGVIERSQAASCKDDTP